MKGIIVQINNNLVAVLSDDGSISRIKNESYELGEVIELYEKKKRNPKLIARVASFIIAIGLIGGGTFAYATPSEYVSLDVNPSFEYSVNRFDRVVNVRAINEDGIKIASTTGIDLSKAFEHQLIDEAMERTIEILREEGYLPATASENAIIITTYGKNDNGSRKLAEELKNYIRIYINSNTELNIKLVVKAVNKALHEEAIETGTTPGKLYLIKKLQESTKGAISVDDWINEPVKDIIGNISENDDNFDIEDENWEIEENREIEVENEREDDDREDDDREDDEREVDDREDDEERND